MEEIIKTEEEKTTVVTEPVIISGDEGAGARRERVWEPFIPQLILTGLIVLVFLVINIFEKDITENFSELFRKMTAAPADEIIEKIVGKAVRIFER